MSENAVVRFPTGGQQIEQPPPEVHTTKLLLDTIVNADNIAQFLPEDSLNKIGQRCVSEYEADDDSRDEWKRNNEQSIKLAKLIKEEKAWPWPGCYSLDTDVLSESGWVPVADLKVGDKVFSRSENGDAGFYPVKATTRYPVNDAVHFLGKSIDLVVSKNHRMVVHDQLGRQEFIEAERFTEKNYTARWLPLTSRTHKESPASIHGIPTRAYLRFLGWYISEGNAMYGENTYVRKQGGFIKYGLSTGSFSIAQSKAANPENYETIKADLEACGFTFKADSRETHFTVHARSMPESLKQELRSLGKCENKFIPRHVFDCATDDLKELLATLILGDGCERNRYGKKRNLSYYTTSVRLASDVQELAQYVGMRGTISERAPRDGGYIRGHLVVGKLLGYQVSINSKTNIQGKKLQASIIPYNGEVACVEVSPHHTLYVRRNGKAVWSGNCANIKYPLLAEACITFAARAYPEIIRGNDVVLARVIGKDPNDEKADRAKRISDYMSYQCTEEMDFWESDTDKLLHLLPIIGTCFRKTYHDPVRAGKMQSGNVSRLVSGMDLIVNHNLTNYEQVRRETEIIDLYENDVIERQRSGLWLDVELNQDTIDGKEDLPRDDKPFRFIEQHRWLDLDEDGYEEPYIATVHLSSRKTVRIVARFDADNVVINQKGEVVHIEATQHYTKYGFIPNPDGGLYDLGFGALLTPLNEAINTVTNQLLDAGTLANLSGGFLAKGIRVKGGQIRLMAGEWKVLDTGGALLKDSILPNPAKEPSPTLFSLLQFLIETGKSIASIKDVLQGNIPNADVPATTVLALIEQGQKVYNSIHKRVYRSLKQEFKKLYKLNARYLPEQQYQMIEDDPRAEVVNDFSSKDYDVCPVSDPQVSSQAQRLAKAQALLQVLGTFPGIKQENVAQDYMMAIGVDDPTRYLPSKEEMEQQAAAQKPKQDLIDHLTLEKALVDIEKNQATAVKTIADAMVSITKAETDKINTQLSVFSEQMKAMIMATSPAPADPNAPQPQQQQVPIGPGVDGGDTQPGGMGPMAQPVVDPMAIQQAGGGNPGAPGAPG